MSSSLILQQSKKIQTSAPEKTTQNINKHKRIRRKSKDPALISSQQ